MKMLKDLDGERLGTEEDDPRGRLKRRA